MFDRIGDGLSSVFQRGPQHSAGSGLQLVNPSQAFRGDQGASQLFGQLNRAQWNDWRARFAPYVNHLASLAQDSGAPRAAANQASGAMRIAFDANDQAEQQWGEGYGIQANPDAQAANQRAASVRGRAAEVSAGNQARISAMDRQQAILAGGMGLSNIPDKVMEQ